ncbi:MAG: 4-(cytidine 5'-diphospho)-2-C-methyl-D-erythritol kinase [Verrucomicrobiae bacterium]|nr:4-(cytidine 5'-diphospho)-2-C-methyl-D-erythritol kinase [Verrucomicrobiae bacterium]
MQNDSRYLDLNAPAKINITLRVLRRRADGFHEIETRMVPVPDVCDRIKVEWIDGGEEGTVALVCSEPDVPVDETNLAVRAVRELQGVLGQPFPALRIVLEKGIPSGAGLGGGSSDAATVLLALNQMAKLGWTLERLAEVAGRIGSDVPFFIYGCPCDCSGRGELVKPIDEGSDLVLPPTLLVKPPFGVETPGAYKRWQDSREIPGVLYAPQSSPVGELVNDLERPVFEKFPFLAELKMWLIEREEVSAALMSGSGATVFAFLKQTAVPELEAELRAHFGEDIWIGRSAG